METFYYIVFGFLALNVAGVVYYQGSGSSGPDSGASVASFRKLRNNYVLVFSLMMAGDWLQGPYVYALYEYYGYQVQDIGRLFIAGFGSSMIFGTVVGSLADKHGRKAAALLYVALYVASCITKHWSSFSVLLLGRITGGIATSLLFSVFEAWLVAEYFARGLDSERWLGDIFSKAVFSGNGLVAILAGLLANYLVEGLQLGPVAPFDAAMFFLTIGGAIIFYTWGENYGDQASSASVSEQFSKAWSAISRDRRVALLGAMQSLFEASMYSFVFLWTPALSSGGEKLPHGFIFACFMAASMLGSGLTGAWLMKRYRVEAYMKAVFAAASATLALPCLLLLSAPAGGAGSKVAGQPAGGISGRGQLMMLCFCAFEVLVGVFWPSMMTMRAVYVPEDLRATIMNCFRIPLNLFVCVILYNVSAFPLAAMFGLCAVFLGLAAMLQVQLEAAIKGGPPGAGLPLSDERPADEGEGLVTKK